MAAERIQVLDVLGEEMSYYGIARPDWALAWIWGFMFGQAVANDAELLVDEQKLRAWAQSTFGAGRRRRKGSPPCL